MQNCIYSLLNYSAKDVYQHILEMRGITIKNKIKIIRAVLTDIREVDRGKPDPNTRGSLIKKAGQSYDELLAKKRIVKEGLLDDQSAINSATTRGRSSI